MAVALSVSYVLAGLNAARGWQRADMDALPVRETTGLPYASTVATADASGNLVGVFAVGLHERRPSLDLSRQLLESLLSFVQHRLRRVKQRHVVTGLGQRKRLMARAAADVEHRRRQMLQQLLVQHVGAHVPLH